MAAAAKERSLAQVAGLLSIGAGAVMAIWIITKAAGANPPPTPLVTVLLLAGALEIALGVGLLRTSRKAWSFALSLDGVLVAVGLFALPAMIRAGTDVLLATLPLAVLVAVMVFLILSKQDFQA